MRNFAPSKLFVVCVCALCSPIISIKGDITGFGGSGVGWTRNGAGGPIPSVVNDVLAMSDVNSYWNARSAFFDTPQAIASFTASFTYQNLTGLEAGGGPYGGFYNPADGIVFTLQNQGPTAIGAVGSSLAFQGISPATGVAINLWNGHQVGIGYAPTSVGNGSYSYSPVSPVDLLSLDPINITITYDGTNLRVELVDTVTQASSSTTYTVNLMNDVGGSTAYVGFTGATGAGASDQRISNFSFKSLCQIVGVPLLKQGCAQSSSCPNVPCPTAPWTCDLYSHYATYPNTISKWGCNLTCCAMLINYQAFAQSSGFSTTPEALNTWLNGQPDGWTGGGGPNPKAVVRYARNVGQILLSYDGTLDGQDDLIVDNYLCGNDPIILWVSHTGSQTPNHYVLATGQTTVNGARTFLINDPGYQNTTLAGYNYHYFGAFKYSSASTPLQALVITAHSPIELLATDPSGNRAGVDPTTGQKFAEIPNSSYRIEAIADDDDPTATDTTAEVKVLELPNPNAGLYTLQVIGTGTGPFSIDFTAYDSNGNPSFSMVSGNAAPGAVLSYEVNYSSVQGSQITVRSKTLAGIVLLNPADQQTLQITGGGSVSLSDKASVFVGSGNTKAFQISGGSSITALNIFITGGYESSGRCTLNPAPLIGQVPVADPLASLPAPSTSGMPSYNTQNISGRQTVVLPPGVYFKQLNISGGANVTFSPGIYVLMNGINVSGGSSINGAGVMLYNSAGQMDFSGSSQVNMSPPGHGGYAGITMFQARNDSYPAKLTGGWQSTMEGTYYFPSAQVSLSGGAELGFGAFIAWTMQVSGGSYECISP
jgi:hypothetical protein